MKEVVVIVVLAAAGWFGWSYYQDQQSEKNAPAPATEAQPVKQTVYSWTDANGVVHFEAQPGAGRKEVVVDTGKISSLSGAAPHSSEPVINVPRPAVGQGGTAYQSLHRPIDKANGAAAVEAVIPEGRKQVMDAN